MTARGKGRSLCQKAREYYYDLLCDGGGAVPEPIAHHVEGCSFCQEQIRVLREALSGSEDTLPPADDATDEETLGALGRQLEFLGREVYCSHVRPFLADLLVPSRQIRIPTPITVHIENCPECARDLASLRELRLRIDQLDRLSQFYAQTSGHSPSLCGPAQSTAVELAALSLDGADPRMLNHVCCCPQCRAWVYERRAQTLADLCTRPVRTGVLACGEVSTADVFDFVVPFDLDADAIGKADGRRDAVVTHVRACPQCMEKVQSLHRVIYGVAERGDSALCTVCRPEQEDVEVREPTQGRVYRYPIRVQVLHREPVPATAPDEPLSPQQATRPGRWIAPGVKTALAAAAVVAMMLFIGPPATRATGVSVGGVREAIERGGNVHIVARDPDKPEPLFETFLAKDRQVIAQKVGDEWTVYQFDKGLGTLLTPGLSPRSWSLRSGASTRCEEFMARVFGGIFAGLSEKDDFSQAKRVAADKPGAHWLVRELTRTDPPSAGVATLHQWKVYFDPVEHLPVKVEYLRQDSTEVGLREVQTTSFEYPTGPEMDKTLRALLPAK